MWKMGQIFVMSELYCTEKKWHLGGKNMILYLLKKMALLPRFDFLTWILNISDPEFIWSWIIHTT